MTKRILVALAIVLFTFLQQAGAETPTVEDDCKDILRDHPGYGLVFMDATLIGRGSVAKCMKTELTVFSQDKRINHIQTRLSFFTSILGGINGFAPGEYVVFSVKCDKNVFNGHFAKFFVRPGEIVNAGNLIIDIKIEGSFSTTFSSQSSIGDIGSETSASIKKRAPLTFARATKRYMTPLNAQAAPSKRPSR